MSSHQEALVPTPKKIRRGYLLFGILGLWVTFGQMFYGKFTMDLGTFENTRVTTIVGDFAKSIRGNRTDNPIFTFVFNPIRDFIDTFVTLIRNVISLPLEGSSIPLIGWLGVLCIIGFIVFATSNATMALLSMALTFGCGALGHWTDSMDTLALVLAAVVLSLMIGIPLGIWAGLSNRALAFLTPTLDLAQILPTLVYLAPLALIFLIGPASATIATMVYSIPISIRITAFAIRGVPASPVEASTSMGTTKRQLLRKVQLPMAARTIVLGVNQTTLAALSFAVIATLIGAPGLGKPVINALIARDVGGGFVAGLAVVLLAVMLDRSTSATVRKSDSFVPPTSKQIHMRRIGKIVAGLVTVIAVILSRQFSWAAYFPEQLVIAKPLSSFANSLTSWTLDNLGFFTEGANTAITVGILNPMESLLTQTPWLITVLAITAMSIVLGGMRSGLVSATLLLAIVGCGLWFDTMVTFTQTIVATMLTMIIGVVLGVWIGRSDRADTILRPFLDAGQVLPAFVYLIPMLGFFGPTRFTAIATGIIYSIPIVVKIVGEGIRGVPTTIIEAATAAGSTTWQIITKVQLPAAKKSLLLATNQGLIFVLAVVVIGGLVGAGALGYLVLLGTSKPEMQGKGLVAGLSILLLGVMIDRITQYAAKRNSESPQN